MKIRVLLGNVGQDQVLGVQLQPRQRGAAADIHLGAARDGEVKDYRHMVLQNSKYC